MGCTRIRSQSSIWMNNHHHFECCHHHIIRFLRVRYYHTWVYKWIGYRVARYMSILVLAYRIVNNHPHQLGYHHHTIRRWGLQLHLRRWRCMHPLRWYLLLRIATLIPLDRWNCNHHHWWGYHHRTTLWWCVSMRYRRHPRSIHWVAIHKPTHYRLGNWCIHHWVRSCYHHKSQYLLWYRWDTGVHIYP